MSEHRYTLGGREREEEEVRESYTGFMPTVEPKAGLDTKTLRS